MSHRRPIGVHGKHAPSDSTAPFTDIQTSAQRLGITAEPVRTRHPLLRWLRAMATGTGRFEGQPYLMKWLVISTLIGLIAGLGALALTFAIDFVTQNVLGRFVHYLPPSPVGEGGAGITPIGRPWLLPIVTMLGGLVSGIIVFSLAPEAEGHGTDAAIEAIHYRRGRVRLRIPPIKLIASAITIGTGGSGGREGPAAQISSGFGSFLGQKLGLSAQDRRIAVAVGMGAGIGAIFRAPLGGAVMAAEILYIHDLEVEALIPTLIASIVGYSVYGSVYGYSPIFGNLANLGFTHPIQLLYYALLGLLCGFGGLLYDRVFYGITGVFHQMPLPRWVRPALGGLLVGLLGLVLPGALHTGYGWVQAGLGSTLLQLPLWVVIALPFAKIVATSLSIGSGGSGGIFGPGMVIGGMLGATFWRLTWNIFPQMPIGPAPFVIIGMMALFGGIAHAPLAVMLMVAEMTGNLSLLAPAMVAVAISTALVGNRTIYRAQIPTRADSPAHRMRFSFPLLSSLLVRDAMASPEPVVHSDESLRDALRHADEQGSIGVIVLNAKDEVMGTLTYAELIQYTEAQGDSTPIEAVLADESVLIDAEQGLDGALERIASRGLSWAPVVDGSHLIGRIHVSDIMHTYKSTLERSVHRATALTSDTALFEVRLTAASPLAGRMLRNAGFPPDTLVVSITRGGETIFPRAATTFEPDDIVMVMANRRSEPMLRAFLEGSTVTEQPSTQKGPQNERLEAKREK